ncbi:MAG: fibronectin type III domain-containing protein [Chloroflexota bacterium]|nr:fibronectin type III domain-containing protein [Chloroflexota bacterium]
MSWSERCNASAVLSRSVVRRLGAVVAAAVLLSGNSGSAQAGPELAVVLSEDMGKTGDRLEIFVTSSVTLKDPPFVTVSGPCVPTSSVDMEPSGPGASYTGTYTVPSGSGDCTATVTASGTDLTGVSESGSAAFRVDRTPLVGTVTFTGTIGANDWHTSDVGVTASATDSWTGIAAIYASVDDLTCSPTSLATCYRYPGPNPVTFTISADGAHTVYAFSQDGAGNFEAQQQRTLKIDRAAPTTTAALSGTLGDNGWYTSPVSVMLSATDNFSGVERTYYDVDDAACSPTTLGSCAIYGDPFSIDADGRHVLAFMSADRAGNVGAQQAREVRVDRTPPSAPSGLQATPGVSSGTVDLRWTAATDATSGLVGNVVRSTLKTSKTCPSERSAYGAATSVGAVNATTISGLAAGKEYCFVVEAVDAAGHHGSLSAAASAKAKR